MFKESNRVYWYLLGIIVGMILLLVIANQVIIPFILGERPLWQSTEFTYSQPPPTVTSSSNDYIAVFDTNFGEITVDLFERAAPNNVNSVVFLANEGYYRGTKFHRLIPDLLLQGGDRNTLNKDDSDDGYGNPGYFIADEVNWDALGLGEEQRESLRSAGYKTSPGLSSKPLSRYVLAMANTRPDSNANHFFFVLATPGDSRIAELQGRFTVIGRVIGGTRVLQKINNIEVEGADSLVPRPTKDIILHDILISTR